MATRIAIIDDREQDRFLARRALATEFSDLTVTEVRDDRELQGLLDSGGGDLIITDYQLRWTDGLQVLARVRAQGLDTPVVMFTHTGNEEIAAAGLRAGLADYIVKTPAHYVRLAHAVRIALQNAAAARSEQDARAREREALRTAEEALRLKDEFLATLSHELRTPLNAITGWLQIIESQSDADRLQKGLAAIGRNTALLTRLIADLVDVSRIVSGTLALQIQTTDVRKIVDAALDSVRPAIQAKRLQVDVRVDNQVSAVAADPDRLQQVAWNLLSNAVKFTPPEGRIRIEAQQVGSMITLSVADTGCGIRSEFLPRVFERFSQQDSTTTREHGGMGLGLAIVRHLTEMHGGTVSVSSVEHEGSTFTVRIPAAPTASRTEQESGAGKTGPRLTGIHVLVVDDDPDAREVIGKMLENAGAFVSSAQRASEAYELLKRSRPDVLVCDIGMPVEDGVAFISRLRHDADARLASIPAVAVTAYAQETDRHRSLHAGFNSHLAKPLSGEDVVGIVRHLAALKRAAYEES